MIDYLEIVKILQLVILFVLSNKINLLNHAVKTMYRRGPDWGINNKKITFKWLTRKESGILNIFWYSQKLLSSIWLDSSKIISILSSFIHSLLLLPSYPRGPYRNLHRSEDKDIYCTAWDILVVENFII